jgi:hypothetical protein
MAALYAQMQKAEEEKAKKEAEAAKDYNNPAFVSMRQGNAYEFRLMYWASGVPGERIVPIIEKTVHAVKAEDGQYHEVTCPSSDYLMGRSGYRACPICNELGKLWDEKEKGSAAAKIAYDKFKRKFKGYAVVYVVNDPTTPENNGTFKILYVNAIINNFLREEIKGVDKKGVKIEGARPIGFKAYDPSANGKNLLVSVTKEGEFNKYTCKFVDPEAGSADIVATPDVLEKAFDELKFDEYYTGHDPEALKKFYEEVFLEKEAAPVEEAAAKAEVPAAEPTKTEAAAEEKAEEQPQEEAAAEVEEAAATEQKAEAPATNGVPDIDSILDGLPG